MTTDLPQLEKITEMMKELMVYKPDHEGIAAEYLPFVSELVSNEVKVYSVISKFIYQIGFEESEKIELIQLNFPKLKEAFIRQSGVQTDAFKKYFESIHEHLSLAITQKIYIEKNNKQIEYTSQQLVKSNNSILTEHQKIKDANNTIKTNSEDLEIKMRNVQKEFVAILGIFASILLAAFGGLSILENVMSNIEKTPTGKLMLFSSLTIAGILLIVFTLLNGVSKLTGLNLRSCGCDADGACDCSMAKKHPTVFIASAVLFFIALAGVSEYVIEYDKLLANLNTSSGVFIAITAGALFVVFVLYRMSHANEYTKKSPSK